MASIFTSLVTSVLDVPGDPSQTITIRKLAPKHLEAARKAAQAQSLRDLREMGGPAFWQELQALAPPRAVLVPQANNAEELLNALENPPETVAVPADPLQLFGRSVLLAHGITAWSYDVELSDASREDLDEDTAVWLATAILKLAKPSLYEADTEAAAKNG